MSFGLVVNGTSVRVPALVVPSATAVRGLGGRRHDGAADHAGQAGDAAAQDEDHGETHQLGTADGAQAVAYPPDEGVAPRVEDGECRRQHAVVVGRDLVVRRPHQVDEHAGGVVDVRGEHPRPGHGIFRLRQVPAAHQRQDHGAEVAQGEEAGQDEGEGEESAEELLRPSADAGLAGGGGRSRGHGDSHGTGWN